MPLLLSRRDVQEVLQMQDCMQVVETAFAELAKGSAVMPLRTNIKPAGGLALYMPAYLPELGALACKVVTVFKDNPSKHDLPTTLGTVLLQDPETGRVTCIMDGGYLTAVRTGAASGVATRYLAPDRDRMTAGVFGAGVQARMQLWAVCEARRISRALVFDVSTPAAETFAETMSDMLGITVHTASSPEQVLDADILCTATSSPTPIFDGARVKPGSHINGIGSHTPQARELDSTIVKRSKFVADSREACLKEAGDIMIPIDAGELGADHIHAELGEIITGARPGRETEDEITLFKSNGLAIQDTATASLVFQKALQAGIGKNVDL